MNPTPLVSRNALNKLTFLTAKAFAYAPLPEGLRERRLSDGGNLYLIVTRTGAASWQVNYRLGGKNRNYSAGRFPAVPLEEARRQRDVVLAQVANGEDPVAARRIRRATLAIDLNSTFGHAYEAWLAKKAKEWSPIHLKISRQAFERDVLPRLGRLPIDKITSPLLTPVIEKIAERGAVDTACKILQHCNGVFRLAHAKGWFRDNPAPPVREALPKRKATGGLPAVLEFP